MKQLAALLVLLPVFAFAAPTPPPEKLLAADTLGVFTIPDYAKARTMWSQWPSTLLWADPELKAFKEKFLGKLKSDLVAPLEKEFGFKFADYSGLAQGQVTLAIMAASGDDKTDATPGFLFLLDARDKTDTLKTNLATMKKKWVDGGKQLKTEKIRDVEFTTLIFSSDDLSKTLDKIFPDPNAGNETLDAPKPKKPGKKIEWLIGQSDSLLIVGTSPKDVEKILIRQGGGAVPSLEEQPAFAANYAGLFRDSPGYLWVNLKTILDLVAKQMGQGAEPKGMGPTPEKILSAIGLNGLQTLSVNLRDTPEGCLFNLLISVPEAARKGLFKLLAFDARDASPPPFVPGDAVKFSRVRLDAQKGWATIENALVEISPQAAGVLKLVMDNAGKDKDPNFDLRKNLIANLGDDLISYQKSPRKPTLADLNSPPSLFLLSSPKAEQLAAALKALGSLLPQQNAKLKEREFLGRTVYTMGLPPTPGPGGGRPVERALSYSASGGYVAMSTDVAMLEEYLRSSENKGKTLRETAGLTEAAQKVGGMSTGLFGYENQAETMRSVLEIMKKESGTFANLFQNSPIAGRLGMGEGDNKFKDWVDFSLLPSFDKIAKYFYMTVYAGSVTTEGIGIKVFAPMPPAMKK